MRGSLLKFWCRVVSVSRRQRLESEVQERITIKDSAFGLGGFDGGSFEKGFVGGSSNGF